MNEEIYRAAMSALTSRGVPVNAAERASSVIAKDDPTKPNLGRSEEDQKNVKDAVVWMNAKRILSQS